MTFLVKTTYPLLLRDYHTVVEMQIIFLNNGIFKVLSRINKFLEINKFIK